MTETTYKAQHPQDSTVGHDLDPNADGDLVRTVAVANTEAFVIALTAQDNEPVSASVDWLLGMDASPDVLLTESATDIELSGVTADWSRLVRKGPVARVTVTSDASDGTQNRVNCWLDTHR